jgi:hypothetical protein
MESNLKELSINFIKYWNEIVKPVAELCSPNDTWEYFYKIEREGLVPDEESPEFMKLKSMKDATGMWYVGWLIRDIETAKLRGVRLDLINSLSQVSGCLSHSNTSYWKNVWNDDFSSNEAINMRRLGRLMSGLMEKL